MWQPFRTQDPKRRIDAIENNAKRLDRLYKEQGLVNPNIGNKAKALEALAHGFDDISLTGVKKGIAGAATHATLAGVFTAADFGILSQLAAHNMTGSAGVGILTTLGLAGTAVTGFFGHMTFDCTRTFKDIKALRAIFR